MRQRNLALTKAAKMLDERNKAKQWALDMAAKDMAAKSIENQRISIVTSP
jgi:hypothetical protein